MEERARVDDPGTRMRPHVRLTQVGTGFGVVAVGLAAGALATAAPGRLGWPVTTLVCCLVLLAICVLQLLAWRRATARWTRAVGGADPDAAGPDREVRLSHAAHVASYAVVLVTLYAGIAASAATGFQTTSAVLQAFALLAAVGAQTLAGTQYVRTSGPPGTVPAHLRRLLARVERSRRGP